MTSHSSLEDLLDSWRKLSDEYLAGFQRAFEGMAQTRRAHPFAAGGKDTEPEPSPTPDAGESGQEAPDEGAYTEPGDRHEPAEAAELDPLAARVGSIDARLSRIEEALMAVLVAADDPGARGRRSKKGKKRKR